MRSVIGLVGLVMASFLGCSKEPVHPGTDDERPSNTNAIAPSAQPFESEGSNWHKVVDPDWVAQLIDGGMPGQAGVPATYSGNGFTILEVMPDKSKSYSRSHLPGAIPLYTGEIEKAPLWNLIPDRQLQEVIEGKGIRWDMTVVIYGEDTTAAARVIWALMYAGVQDVRLLVGGVKAWKEFGAPVEQKENQPHPVVFGRSVPAHPEFLASPHDVREMSSRADWTLVSVRSKAEFVGKRSGYSYIKPKGRIPWAIWGKDGVAIAEELDPLKDPTTVQHFWESQGITKDQNVTFYCGTGWRSSVAFYYAHLLGYPKISNFDGSWLEWSSDASNPISSGEPILK